MDLFAYYSSYDSTPSTSPDQTGCWPTQAWTTVIECGTGPVRLPVYRTHPAFPSPARVTPWSSVRVPCESAHYYFQGHIPGVQEWRWREGSTARSHALCCRWREGSTARSRALCCRCLAAGSVRGLHNGHRSPPAISQQLVMLGLFF